MNRIWAPVTITAFLGFSPLYIVSAHADVSTQCKELSEAIVPSERSNCTRLVDEDGLVVTDEALITAILGNRRGKITGPAPRYPNFTGSESESGYRACVFLRFDIDERGRTRNIKVAGSAATNNRTEPFENAALGAARKWRYPRFHLNGRRYSCEDYVSKTVFTLED